MTDGQIYLSSELFYEGVKPAIDVGLSVSRIGNKVQPPLFRWVSSSLRLELLQYQELQRLSRFSAMNSQSLAQRQRRGAILRRLMSQPIHQPSTLADQSLLFYALKTGWLERLTEEGLRMCLSGLSTRLPAFAQEAIRENQPVTPILQAKLNAALEEVLRPYAQPEGEAHAATEIPAR